VRVAAWQWCLLPKELVCLFIEEEALPLPAGLLCLSAPIEQHDDQHRKQVAGEKVLYVHGAGRECSAQRRATVESEQRRAATVVRGRRSACWYGTSAATCHVCEVCRNVKCHEPEMQSKVAAFGVYF